MLGNDIESRRQRYFRLSTEIAQIDDARLLAIFSAAEGTNGWGRNHVLEIGGAKVFVKRVPLTDLEYENRYSTRNLYDLPTYYNYGVGSAGFGVFRELVANIKTTNWVLDGQIETFPLLYHHRICRAPGAKSTVDMDRHNRYVEYWEGNENIGRYVLDRADANHELVLFLEYVPNVLHPWLKVNPGRTASVLEQLHTTFDFLRSKGVIHFDAHFANILVDSERPYLTDFGLVLDKSFDLSDEERKFFELHTPYDFSEVLSCISYIADQAFEALTEEEKLRVRLMCGFDEAMEKGQRLALLLDHLTELAAKGVLPLDPSYVESIARYRKVTILMGNFFRALHQSNKKDAPFPREELLRCMAEAGHG